ncbi:MAG: DUF1501 domain-containing protein [Rhodoferax sp.]
MTHSSFASTRRGFLQRSAGMAASAMLPMGLNLAALGEAAAFNATAGDYKALVCVFLYGGNDYANTVVTYDTPSYNQYNTIRGGSSGIALSLGDLAATVLSPTAAPVDSLGASRQFALHPAMPQMAGLFNSGQAAVLLNVGPLVKPLTRDQYVSSNRALYPLPPKLFSHNDQQSIWQSSSPEGSTLGWGGGLGDQVIGAGLNSNNLFSCISVTGNAVYLGGGTALQYQISTSGAIKIRPATDSTVYGSAGVRSALATLIRDNARSHALEAAYNAVTARAMDAEVQVTAALSIANSASFATPFPSNGLGPQLRMVARIIKGRATLGARRQVFFVSLGGFDLHDNLISQQPVLLGRVNDALKAFYDATVEMGVASQVTSFTASDFGRTLSSNGDGSDHGWGGHHFIVGGAVRGRAFYGEAPPVSVLDDKSAGLYVAEAQWHVGQGRLLPRVSVDQYAATLAKWFGVADADMAQVLPNIGNFGGSTGYPVDLGFMA